MHECTLLITEELPNEDMIEKMLATFYEEDFYNRKEKTGEPYPTFLYDYYQIGGRYAGMIKLNTSQKNSEYTWECYSENQRNNRLFISSILEKLNKHNAYWECEEDWYRYMGMCNGYLYVDGAKIKDIINLDTIRGCNLVIPTGEACTRTWWNGNTFVDNPLYDETVKTALETYQDYFLTILDIHN